MGESSGFRNSLFILMLFFIAIIGVALIYRADQIFTTVDDFQKFIAVVAVGLSMIFFSANQIFARLPFSKENESKVQLQKIYEELKSCNESLSDIRTGINELIPTNEKIIK